MTEKYVTPNSQPWVCLTCGVMVGDTSKHNEWHKDQRTILHLLNGTVPKR